MRTRAFGAILVGVVALGIGPSLTSPSHADEAQDQVCRATVSALFGRDVDTIKIVDRANGIVTTRYRRPDDGKLWTVRCRVRGNQVIWASETGRWRDHPLDEKFTFLRDDRKIVIRQTFSDNSSITETYAISDLD